MVAAEVNRLKLFGKPCPKTTVASWLGARLQQLGHEAGPAGLMRGTHAAAGVAVKIFMEQDVVLEVGIVRELRMIFENGTLAVLAFQEKLREALRDFAGDFVDGEKFSRAGRTFDFEIIAVVAVELLERFDEQKVHWHPDRAAPVGVAAEDAGLGLGGPVGDFMHHAAASEAKRLVLVDFGERADAVVGKKLGFVEHPAEQAFHAMTAQQREQLPLALATFLPA